MSVFVTALLLGLSSAASAHPGPPHTHTPPPPHAPKAPPPGHRPAAAPAVTVLNTTITCELDAIDATLRVALPALTKQSQRPMEALRAHTMAGDKRQTAKDLLAKGETGLAMQRTAEARKQLKVLLKPLWEVGPPAELSPALQRLHACGQQRMQVTSGPLRAHALNGPRTAYAKAGERMSQAAMSFRTNDVRMGMFTTLDGLHQLDVAMGWQWPSTKPPER